MFQLLPFFETETFHDLRHAISGAKIPHQIVFEADVETRRTRIALTRTTSAQLSIDATRLMSLRPDHVKTAPVRDALPKFNVRAAPGHVRRNRDRSSLASAGDDLRLLHVKFRVQDVMRNLFALQHARK